MVDVKADFTGHVDTPAVGPHRAAPVAVGAYDAVVTLRIARLVQPVLHIIIISTLLTYYYYYYYNKI